MTSAIWLIIGTICLMLQSFTGAFTYLIFTISIGACTVMVIFVTSFASGKNVIGPPNKQLKPSSMLIFSALKGKPFALWWWVMYFSTITLECFYINCSFPVMDKHYRVLMKFVIWYLGHITASLSMYVLIIMLIVKFVMCTCELTCSHKWLLWFSEHFVCVINMM